MDGVGRLWCVCTAVAIAVGPALISDISAACSGTSVSASANRTTHHLAHPLPAPHTVPSSPHYSMSLIFCYSTNVLFHCTTAASSSSCFSFPSFSPRSNGSCLLLIIVCNNRDVDVWPSDFSPMDLGRRIGLRD